MIDMSSFVETGVHHLEHRVDSFAARELLRAVHNDRAFGPGLFMAERDFKANPVFKGVNPRLGRNLAEKLHDLTLFVDDDPVVRQALSVVLGEGYSVMDKKFVCGIPQEWIPDWVKQYIVETGVKNLGPYMRPEYRDITYFSGIDFHQDIIDWPSMGPKFITLYVYLDDVGLKDAPLHVMPGTHVLGATCFPHALEHLGAERWRYTTDIGEFGEFSHHVLVGSAGDISFWHPFILHGTQPDANSEPRISLRYLIGMADPDCLADCELRRANERIAGHMALDRTREDLGESGQTILKGNHVNKLGY